MDWQRLCPPVLMRENNLQVTGQMPDYLSLQRKQGLCQTGSLDVFPSSSNNTVRICCNIHIQTWTHLIICVDLPEYCIVIVLCFNIGVAEFTFMSRGNFTAGFLEFVKSIPFFDIVTFEKGKDSSCPPSHSLALLQQILCYVRTDILFITLFLKSQNWQLKTVERSAIFNFLWTELTEIDHSDSPERVLVLRTHQTYGAELLLCRGSD